MNNKKIKEDPSKNLPPPQMAEASLVEDGTLLWVSWHLLIEKVVENESFHLICDSN